MIFIFLLTYILFKVTCIASNQIIIKESYDLLWYNNANHSLSYLFERLFYSKGHFQLPYGYRCVNETAKAFVSMAAAMWLKQLWSIKTSIYTFMSFHIFIALYT